MAKRVRKPKPTAGVKGDRTKILAAYKQMLKYQFVGTGILVAVITTGLTASYNMPIGVPLVPLMMLAGMLGAFFSALTRLYNVDQVGIVIFTSTVQDLGGGPYLLMYSFVPPIIGMIAAVILYLVFVAGYLNTDLFPKFECRGVCNSMQDLMANYYAKGPENYGKALVWGFIAGFSERLVPNMLTSLASKAEKERSK